MTLSYATFGYQETPVRVPFGFVDAYGTLWHGHVPSFCEQARADVARPFGLSAPALLQVGLAVPMLELSCRYKAPAFDDELIVVQSTLLKPHLPVPELVFLYRLVREGSAEEIARVRTRQLIVRRDGRVIVRMPREIQERLDRLWAHLATQPAWVD